MVNDTQNVTRTNTVNGSGTPRLGGWTQNSTVTVTLRCDTSGTYVSFYQGLGGVPVVTVTAVVPVQLAVPDDRVQLDEPQRPVDLRSPGDGHMSRLALILRRQDAATSAEFAMVLPLLILFLLGTIDVGRYMWGLNKIEKATQMGARMAVVTTMVPGGLAAANYGTSLGQGASIPTSSFGAAQCAKPAASVTCTCATTPCPTLTTPVDTAAFNAVAERMKLIAPMVTDPNVTIDLYAIPGLAMPEIPTGPRCRPDRHRNGSKRPIPSPRLHVPRRQFDAADGQRLADA